MRRLLAAALLSLIICGALLSQEVVVGRRRQSTPAGTAPSITSASSCGSTNTICATNINSVTGQTSIAIVDGSPSGTVNVTNANSDSYTCTPDTFNSNQIVYCQAVMGTTNASLGANCHTSSATFWLSCVIYQVSCASTCVASSPTFNHNASSTTSTAPSITTTHQLNMLILSGFGIQNSGFSTGADVLYTPTSPYAFQGTAACQSTAGCGQAQNSGKVSTGIEYRNVTSLGTYNGSATIPHALDTDTWTVQIY